MIQALQIAINILLSLAVISLSKSIIILIKKVDELAGDVDRIKAGLEERRE